MPLRTALKSLVPPLALAGYRRTKRLFVAPQSAAWSVPRNWPNRAPVDGFSHQSNLAAQVRKWPYFYAVLDGHGPLGVAHEADDPHAFDVGAQNTVMCFAYVLARVVGARESIAMLDWGCGLGHYARLAKALLPESTIRYVGQAFPLLTAAASARVSLYAARLPTHASVPSFAVVQRPHRWGYLTTFHEGDVREQPLLDSVTESVDVVFSLVGLSGHRQSMLAPFADLDANTAAPLALLHACRRIVDSQPLLFFHFHGLKRMADGVWDTSLNVFATRLDLLLRRSIYRPYLQALERAMTEVNSALGETIASSVRATASAAQASWLDRLRFYKRSIKGQYIHV